MSAAETARAAGVAAAKAAMTAFDGTPVLAIVFVSASYSEPADAARGVEDVIGKVPIIGGTAGMQVFANEATLQQGVSVTILGGELEIAIHEARLASPTLLEAVPAAEAVAKAAEAALRRGLPHYGCLVFAPGMQVDGEALVAAVRKGAGERAVLAGALTGDDMTMDRTKVFSGGELRGDRVVVAGLFSKSPIGVAARHGYRAVGPVREVTRADGPWLVELDGRSALDVWREDARTAGADPPSSGDALLRYLLDHCEIGIVEGPPTPRAGHIPDESRELVARAPFRIRDDGAMQLSASIGEGTHVRVLHASRDDLLRASEEAATAAVHRAGSRIAGALVLGCTGRLAILGDRFREEPDGIRAKARAPIGGTCVFGEIARNVRDADAFFNTTVVVVAFGA